MNKASLLFLLFILALRSYATDLLDVYHQSLENDPVFKQAYSAFMAKSQQIPETWAALLPQLTVQALAGRNALEVQLYPFDVTKTYNGDQWKVSASQALFNYQAWSQVQRAKASVKAALATFNDTAQNLILRTTTSYLNILLAIDTLNYAEAKKQANKKQLQVSQQRFNVGLDPMTYVYEAQAAYDQSTAEVIAAQNNLENQNQNLSRLTNHIYDKIAGLRNSKIPLIRPEPANINEWISTGLKQNYNLLAAKYNLEAARENIKAHSAGNWPTFAVQGTTTTSHNNIPFNNNVTSIQNLLNGVFVPNKQVISNVAVTMNFPIFQGGLVIAQTKEAEYNFQSTSEQLESVYRNVLVNSTIAFNTIMADIDKVKADRATLLSQQSSLDSVQAQYEVGLRTMTDVVTAQQHLFQAQQQLATDQYALINAILNLKYLAGTLNVNDLEEINAWLDTPRIQGLPPQFRRKT